MKQQIKKLVTAALLIQLTACVTLVDENGLPGSFSPTPLFLRNLPQGGDSYSLGFRHGCYNFIGQNGFGVQRMYDVSYDVTDYLDDPLYNQGYKQGDRYCGVYVNKGIIL